MVSTVAYSQLTTHNSQFTIHHSPQEKVWFLYPISLTFVPENEERKGNEIVPFFICQMNSTLLQERLENMVAAMLEGNEDYFLVDLRIRPGNNIKVILDADSGVTIDKCVDYNRKLYRQLEAEGLFPDGDFSLEVSSAGIDEPLKLDRQYKKNLGRHVEVILKDGARLEGKLIEANEAGLIIEETRGKNKKKEVVVHNIPFSDIKTTKVQVVF
jgi:ribosome maturation factor RimP